MPARHSYWKAMMLWAVAVASRETMIVSLTNICAQKPAAIRMQVQQAADSCVHLR